MATDYGTGDAKLDAAVAATQEMADWINAGREIAEEDGDHTRVSIYQMMDAVLRGNITVEKVELVGELGNYARYLEDADTSSNERKRFAAVLPSLSPWKHAKAMVKANGGQTSRSSSGQTSLDNILGKERA